VYVQVLSGKIYKTRSEGCAIFPSLVLLVERVVLLFKNQENPFIQKLQIQFNFATLLRRAELLTFPFIGKPLPVNS